MKKHQETKWPLARKIQIFLLVFGALTVILPMIVSMTSEKAVLTQGQVLGILIASLLTLESGAILGTVLRYRAGKDISFSIGACIGLLLVGLLQIFG